MKMVFCLDCGDLFNCTYEYKECSCGKSKGYHIDYENMVYSGEYAVAMRMDNFSLHDALINIPLDGRGVDVETMVIPYYCNSAIRVPDAHEDYLKFYKAMPHFTRSTWDTKINNIRIKNPLLKLLYNIFKKYIFISVKEI